MRHFKLLWNWLIAFAVGLLCTCNGLLGQSNDYNILKSDSLAKEFKQILDTVPYLEVPILFDKSESSISYSPLSLSGTEVDYAFCRFLSVYRNTCREDVNDPVNIYHIIGKLKNTTIGYSVIIQVSHYGNSTSSYHLYNYDQDLKINWIYLLQSYSKIYDPVDPFCQAFFHSKIDTSYTINTVIISKANGEIYSAFGQPSDSSEYYTATMDLFKLSADEIENLNRGFFEPLIIGSKYINRQGFTDLKLSTTEFYDPSSPNYRWLRSR